jgi:hypothetical protein
MRDDGDSYTKPVRFRTEISIGFCLKSAKFRTTTRGGGVASTLKGVAGHVH